MRRLSDADARVYSEWLVGTRVTFAARAITRLSTASSSDGDVSIHAVCDVRCDE